MKRLVVLIYVFLSPYISKAQSSISTIEKLEKSEKNWTTEAQLNTASNSYAATFGPSLLYKLNRLNQIGFRFLTPVGAGENGTISLMALYRHEFGESKTNLFGEGSFGTNWYYSGEPRTVLNAPSIGTNLGVIHHLTEDISFGGLAGFEWTRTRLDNGVVSNDPDSIHAWGRIALFGSLNF